MIITNTPEEYNFLSLPIYKDIYGYKGPLAGIHSGLIHSKTKQNFIISCDIPLMTKEMIQYIVECRSEKPIKFCEAAGYHQPLAGVYSKSVIAEVEKVISDENAVTDKSFHHFLKKVDAEIIHPENLPFYRDDIFFNVNSKSDYEHILKSAL